MKIEGCRAIVTGGSSGIGLATAQVLIQSGASHVGLVARTKLGEAVMDTILVCVDVPGPVAPRLVRLPCDVRDIEQLQSAFSEFVNVADGLDVLVNCAGVMLDGAMYTPKTRYSIEDWDTIIDTNLRGTFLCSQLAVEAMFKRRIHGVIVNMSSVSRRGRAGQVAYSASKGGISSMTAAMAQELAAYKIRCVAIAPGLIDTPMAAQVPESHREEIRKATAVHRLGKAEEVAATVLHCIENDFLNGCTIDVDGGFAG